MSMYINELKLKRVAHNLVAVSITTLRSLLSLRRKLKITDCTEIFDFRLTPFSVNRHFFEELNANRNWIHNAFLFIWLEPDKQKCDILPNHTDAHTVGPNQNFFMTRSLYKAGVRKKGFAFDELLFFSA